MKPNPPVTRQRRPATDAIGVSRGGSLGSGGRGPRDRTAEGRPAAAPQCSAPARVPSASRVHTSSGRSPGSIAARYSTSTAQGGGVSATALVVQHVLQRGQGDRVVHVAEHVDVDRPQGPPDHPCARLLGRGGRRRGGAGSRSAGGGDPPSRRTAPGRGGPAGRRDRRTTHSATASTPAPVDREGRAALGRARRGTPSTRSRGRRRRGRRGTGRCGARTGAAPSRRAGRRRWRRRWRRPGDTGRARRAAGARSRSRRPGGPSSVRGTYRAGAVTPHHAQGRAPVGPSRRSPGPPPAVASSAAVNPDLTRRVRTDADVRARRFGAAWTAGVAGSRSAWFWWMVTEATGNLLRYQPLNGDFFDGEARSLLDGNLAVAAVDPEHRGLRPTMARRTCTLGRSRRSSGCRSVRGDRLARRPPVRRVHGDRVALHAGGGRRALRGGSAGSSGRISPSGGRRPRSVALFTVLVGIGSPLFFTGSRSWVYRGPRSGPWRSPCPRYDQIVALLADPTRGRLAPERRSPALSALGPACRFGAGPIAALGIVLLVVLVVQIRPGTGRASAGWACPNGCTGRGWLPGMARTVAIPIVIFAAQKHREVRHPVLHPVRHPAPEPLRRPTAARVPRRTAGRWSLRQRFPPSSSSSCVPTPCRSIQDLPPGRLPDKRRPTVIGDLLFDQHDYTAGITATMPLLVALAVAGVVGAIRRRALAVVRVPILGALAVLPISLSFLYVARAVHGATCSRSWCSAPWPGSR